MTRFGWLFLMVFWTPAALRAADEHRISLDKHFFDLLRTGIIIDEVIDGRAETYCEGFAQKGIGNKKVPARLDGGVETELKGVFDRSLVDRTNGQVYTLRVNHLFLYEITYGNREVAVAELNVSFLERTGDGYLERYEVGATTERYGVDVTGSHDKNIVKALENCINRFGARRKAGNLWSRPVAEDQLRTRPFQPTSYPVLQTQIYPRGIYPTFGEFRDNEPDESRPFSVSYDKPGKDGQVTAQLEWDGEEGPEEQGIWGFSDGRDVYLHLGRRYYRLSREADAFTLMARAPESGGGSTFGYLLGGVVGGLLFTALEYGSKETMAYQVNFATGALIPRNLPGYRRIAARTYFCFSKFEKADARLSITVAGRELCTLSPGEYYVLWTPPGADQVEVCLRTADGATCETITPELFNKDLFLCRTKRGSGPAIDHPNPNIRQDLYYDIRNDELRAACGE